MIRVDLASHVFAGANSGLVGRAATLNRMFYLNNRVLDGDDFHVEVD